MREPDGTLTAPLIQIIRERFVTIYVAEFSEESTLNIREGILQAETTGQTILPGRIPAMQMKFK